VSLGAAFGSGFWGAFAGLVMFVPFAPAILIVYPTA